MPSNKKKSTAASRKKKKAGGQNKTPTTTTNEKPKGSKSKNAVKKPESPVDSSIWMSYFGMRPPIEEARIICDQLEAEGIIPADQNWFKYPDQAEEGKSPEEKETEAATAETDDVDGELEINIEVIQGEKAPEEEGETAINHDGDNGEIEVAIEKVHDVKAPEIIVEETKGVNSEDKDKDELDIDIDVDIKVIKGEKAPKEAEAVDYEDEGELDVDIEAIQPYRAPLLLPMSPYNETDSDTDDPDANDSSKEEEKTVTVTSSCPAVSDMTNYDQFIDVFKENLIDEQLDVSTVEAEADVIVDVDIVQTLNDLVRKIDRNEMK